MASVPARSNIVSGSFEATAQFRTPFVRPGYSSLTVLGGGADGEDEKAGLFFSAARMAAARDSRHKHATREKCEIFIVILPNSVLYSNTF